MASNHLGTGSGTTWGLVLRVHTVVGAVLAVAMLGGVAATAAPEVASGCTSGSAWAAGPLQPHAADPAGDAYAPEPGLDLRAAWVGVIEGAEGEPVYTINIAVEDLSAARPGSSYQVEALGTVLVASIAPDGSWSFSDNGIFLETAGVPAGQNAFRSIPGSVDLDAELITMTIPADRVPTSTQPQRFDTSTSLRVGGWRNSATQSIVVPIDGYAVHRCDVVFDGFAPA